MTILGPNPLHNYNNYGYSIFLSAINNEKYLENQDFEIENFFTNNDIIIIAATGGTYNISNSILNYLQREYNKPPAKGDYLIDDLEIKSVIDQTQGVELVPSNLSVEISLTIKEPNGFSFLNSAKWAYDILNPPQNEESIEARSPGVATVFAGEKGILQSFLLSIIFNSNNTDDTQESQNQNNMIREIHQKVNMVGGSMKITETGTEYRLKLNYFNAKQLIENDPALKNKTVTLSGSTVQNFIDDYIQKHQETSKEYKSNIVYKIIPANPEAELFFKSDIIDLDESSKKLFLDEQSSVYNVSLGVSLQPQSNSQKYSSSAAGAYQMVRDTRRDIMKDAGITDAGITNESIYNQATQDKLAEALYERDKAKPWNESVGIRYGLDLFKGKGFNDSITLTDNSGTFTTTPKDIIRQLESGNSSGDYDAVLNNDPKRPGDERKGKEVLEDWWKIIKKTNSKPLSKMTIAEVDEFQTYLLTKGDPNPTGSTSPQVLASTADARRAINEKLDSLLKNNTTGKKLSLPFENNINRILPQLLFMSVFYAEKFNEKLDARFIPFSVYVLNSVVNAKKEGNILTIEYKVYVKEISSPIYLAKEKDIGSRLELFKSKTLKEYNYLFTGKNIDILNLDIDFRNIAGYFYPVSLNRNQSNDTATAGAVATSVAEDSIVPTLNEGETSTLNEGDSFPITELKGLDVLGLPRNITDIDSPFDNSLERFYRSFIIPVSGDSSLTILEMTIVGDYDFLPYSRKEEAFTYYTDKIIKLNIGNNVDFKINEAAEDYLKTNYLFDAVMFTAYYRPSFITSRFESSGKFTSRINAAILIDELFKETQ